MISLGILAALSLPLASAQTVLADGCMRLIGSAACPAFSYAYVHPQNLSNAFPWLAGVTNVNEFDAAVFNYFSSPYEWQATKFGNDELGCTNATNAYIRWTRTVLCSMWVNEQWSVNCDTYYNGSSAATSMKMVCQQTCLQYAASENQIANNPTYCPTDNTGGNRSYTLQKDFVDCTNWGSLQTANMSTCVPGEANEGNCGYGSSSEMLCNYCNNSNPDSCCYSSNTDISVCGFALPAQSSSNSASASATSTTSSSSSTSASSSSSATGAVAQLNSGLSGGQKAGIAVGSIIGGILLIALLALLVFFCCIKPRRREEQEYNRDSGSSFAPSAAVGAGTGAAAGGMFGLFGGKGKPEPNASEKGLVRGNNPNASSPTMGGDTLYSRNGNRSHESAGLAGLAGAGAVGAGAGAAFGHHVAGERTSGVVLPRVKDENQNGDRWIETGSEVTVLWPYQASLPDELDLRPGMKLRVLRLYDDAWGTAQVISGGEGSEVGKQGAFPIVCVSEGSSLGSSMSTGSH